MLISHEYQLAKMAEYCTKNVLNLYLKKSNKKQRD